MNEITSLTVQCCALTDAVDDLRAFLAAEALDDVLPPELAEASLELEACALRLAGYRHRLAALCATDPAAYAERVEAMLAWQGATA